ncbi:MAG: hypothetical protein WAJ93_08060 [Candidatus Nitrosopolaris sp.]
MRLYKTNHNVVLSALVILVVFSILGFPLGQDRYAHSQSSTTKSNPNAAGAGVDLVNTRTSPLDLKAGSKFEIISTIVNNSPKMIMFIAGACDSPLSASFARNVMIRHLQGCTSTSPSFELTPGEQVSVAGPSSGTIYQAIAAGQISATATLHYQSENGQAATVTKPFVFTIS